MADFNAAAGGKLLTNRKDWRRSHEQLRYYLLKLK